MIALPVVVLGAWVGTILILSGVGAVTLVADSALREILTFLDPDFFAGDVAQQWWALPVAQEAPS